MNKQVLALCAFFAFASGLNAQTAHFTFTSNTGNNATVAIPLGANPNINGIPLQPGDEVGVFADGLVNPDSFCVGAVVWNGANNAITVWGDNDQTPQLDGIRAGSPMYFHVWQRSTGIEYSDVHVNYSEGNGIYTPNGVYIVSSLSVSTIMAFSRDSISFGAIQVDSVANASIYMTDISNDPIPIDSIYTGTKIFSVIPSHGTISGHDSLKVVVYFSPNSAQVFKDTLFISSSSLPSIAEIPLLGNGIVTSVVRSPSNGPAGFRLMQNYPNPFNPSTVISYDLPDRGYVLLKIYDDLGREVALVVDGVQSAGEHKVTFDAADLPSGLYFYTLRRGTVSITRKMLLLK